MVWRETDRVRARRKEVRERILRESLRLVGQGGFPAIQMAAVAQRSQVAVGTVYRYFPGKAELIAEVFRWAAQREVDVLTEVFAGHGTAPARLESAVRLWCARAQRGDRLARSLLVEPVQPEVDALRLTYRAAFADMFAGVIREGIERGELADQDPSVTAACIVGALAEAALGPAELPGPASIDCIARFCMAAVGAAPASLPSPRSPRSAEGASP